MVKAQHAGLWLLALGLAAGALACGGDSKQTSTPNSSLPPSLMALGELAVQEGDPVTIKLSAMGGDVPLLGDASLHVEPGALSQDTELTVVRAAVDLDSLSFYVKNAFSYTLRSQQSIPQIAPPLRLVLCDDSGSQIALRAAGDAVWEKRTEYTASSSAVTIDHFSEQTFVFVEPMPALTATAALPATAEEQNKVGLANDFIRDYANEWERAFLGIGETGSPQEQCQELEDMLAQQRSQWTFAFPVDVMSDPLFSTFHMGKFLFTSKKPSEVQDPERLFWVTTLPSQAAIRARVLASSHPLTPAEVLTIAVEENGNNAALGVLAAHNFLKEMTTDGRDMIVENFGDPFKGEIAVGPTMRNNPTSVSRYEENARQGGGEVAAHLQTWRSSERSPAGTYDKMGPIYHVFAALASAVYMPHIEGGSIAVAGETLMRFTGITGDVADPEKGQADLCGAKIGNLMADLFLDPVVPISQADAGQSTTNSRNDLRCGQKPWNGDRCYFVWEAPRMKCTPGEGAQQYTYTWQPFTKDQYYYYFTVSYFDYLSAFTTADSYNGLTTLDCKQATLSETLACQVTEQSASTSDCLEAARIGTGCNAAYGLTNVCGQCQLSKTFFADGTQSFDELWAFMKAHAATNNSYDVP